LQLTAKTKGFCKVFVGSFIVTCLIFGCGFYCGIRSCGNNSREASRFKSDLESARRSNAEIAKQLERQKLDYQRAIGDKDKLRAENKRLGDAIERLNQLLQSDTGSIGEIGQLIKKGRAVTSSLTE
jgi:hypothetical protein